ncbi:MAG TPA: UvrD-helicase domain-containing protein [Thermoanaerobaculia bacterium]|jgi:ATP-dependent helicase/nuclease subunit A
MNQQLSLFGTPAPPRDERANLVIEAGAGTGKTTAIVAEVLKLMLEREDLAPERVVLMTFTEKAAGEIAERIRGALEELSSMLSVVGSQLSGEHRGQPTTDNRQQIGWPVGSPNPLVVIGDPERARASIRHHLANIDALRSQTIHSFCQSILRSFPLEAGLDPQFKIVEGFERSLLYDQVYEAWLDRETRVEPVDEVVREWEVLFGYAGYLFQIRNLILTLSNRRDLLGERDYELGSFEADVLPQLEDALLWIRRDTATCKDSAAAAVAAYLRDTPFSGGTLDAWIDYLQPIAPSLRDIDFRYCGALKQPMTFLRSGNKGDSIYDRLAGHRAALALVSLTRRFLAFLDGEKHKLGVVDFDDLLLRTQAVLEDEQVLARARAQFDHIFVDEFQDTDRTQANIIRKLARDPHGRYVPGRTVVVGDPKQSIYGFRRADPETYYRMTTELRDAGAERQVLDDQYRSDAPLLETINAMFTRLFPEEEHDPNVFRPAYNVLRAARPAVRRELDARVTLLHAQHEDKTDRFFAEAEAIAEWIRRNRDGGPKDLQRFAILFRRLTILDDYLDTLRRYEIDYVLPPTRSFLDRRAPVDLVAVLRAIAYPFDKGAQISAARTPYFALTDVEIVAGLRVAEGAAPETWRAFEEAIARYRDAAQHASLTELIDLLVTTTNIEQVYDAAADGERHLAHLERVRALAFEYEQRRGGSVRQFVDEITERREEPEEMEPTLLDESQNAVRIMTVHAAKGLEFGTVILPDLSFQASGGGVQLFTVEEPRRMVLAGGPESLSANFGPGGEPLKKIAREREQAEMLRLFYVAVTRAETDVVLVFNPEEKKTGFHKAVLTLLGDPSFPDEGREVRMTEIGPVAFEKLAAARADSRVRKRLRDRERERELAGEIVPWDGAAPEPVAELLSPAAVAATRAGAKNRAAGTLLHRVLELWDGRADTEPLLRQLAAEAAADADAVSRVRKRLAVIARSPFLQRIANAETIGRELPVRFVEDGILVERRIDRLVREPDGDLVIDYKSGAPQEERVERDREQVARYCRAISAITGRPCAGALWYVGLDGDVVVGV